MKQPGFVIVDARNDSAAKLHFTFTTADGKSTQLFSNLSHRAIINYPHFKQDAERAKVFIEIIQEATQQYLKDFIGNKQDEKEGMFLLFNFTHGEKDILRAHEVFNYINNHTPRAASFQDLVEDIYQLTKWTGIRKKSSDNSLITKIDALMLEKLASTMRDYRNEVKDPRVKGERGIKLV